MEKVWLIYYKMDCFEIETWWGKLIWKEYVCDIRLIKSWNNVRIHLRKLSTFLIKFILSWILVISFGRLFHSLITCGKTKVYDWLIPSNGLNLMSLQRWQTGRMPLGTSFIFSMRSWKIFSCATDCLVSRVSILNECLNLVTLTSFF